MILKAKTGPQHTQIRTVEEKAEKFQDFKEFKVMKIQSCYKISIVYKNKINNLKTI